jgi:hypothetical protein
MSGPGKRACMESANSLGHVWNLFKVGFDEISPKKRAVFIAASIIATVALPIIGLTALAIGVGVVMKKGEKKRNELVVSPLTVEQLLQFCVPVGIVGQPGENTSTQERLFFFKITLGESLRVANEKEKKAGEGAGSQTWAAYMQSHVKEKKKMSEMPSEAEVAEYYTEKLGTEIFNSSNPVVSSFTNKLGMVDPDAVRVLKKIAELATKGMNSET